jgi:hypothetical protein
MPWRAIVKLHVVTMKTLSRWRCVVDFEEPLYSTTTVWKRETFIPYVQNYMRELGRVWRNKTCGETPARGWKNGEFRGTKNTKKRKKRKPKKHAKKVTPGSKIVIFWSKLS